MTGLKILIVDDNTDVCDALREWLTEHQVTTVHSGPEALRLVQHERFEVILLDLWMPGCMAWRC